MSQKLLYASFNYWYVTMYYVMQEITTTRNFPFWFNIFAHFFCKAVDNYQIPP